MVWSLTAVPSAGALVDAGELRKTIREIDLLNKRQPRDEAQPSKDDNSSASDAREQSRPVSSEPKPAFTQGEYAAVNPSATAIDPLPVVDTSLMAYPSLTVAPFRSATMASVVSASPAVVDSPPPVATIEASPGGWQVAGVAWYWWLLSILAVGVGARWYLGGRKQAALVSSKE